MEIDWDWRLFLEYIDVLAWPVVLVSIVVVFRGRLRELLGRMKQAEAGGFKAEFAEAKQEAKAVELQGLEPGPAVEQSPAEETPEGESPPSRPPARRRGAKSEVILPSRLPTAPTRILRFKDLIDAFRLLEAYDEVVLDLSEMKSGESGRLAASMWAMGLEMGSERELVVTEAEKEITIRHAD